MRADQELKQRQNQRIAPSMIVANKILRLSVMELHQAVEQELNENPALVVPEDDPCAHCDQPRVLCVECPLNKTKQQDEVVSDLTIYDGTPFRDISFDDEDARDDLLQNIGSRLTLPEYLLPIVSSIVTDERYHIAEYLIANIKENGYLGTSVEQAAIDLTASIEEVEDVLAVIHTIDPPGIGARNIQECLHIQLLLLSEEGNGNDVALQIVAEHWDDLGTGKLRKIARKMKQPFSTIVSAIDFIKNKLTPYPADTIRQYFENETGSDTGGIRPDIIVTRDESGFNVEVVGFNVHYLRISSRYLVMYQDIKEGGGEQYSDEERNHVVTFVDRAKAFVEHINQRKKTLKRIAEFVVEFQQGFLETSSKSFLRPLTRTLVAEKLGLHESTVSRASSNKYIQLPDQTVLPFEILFDVSGSIKDMLLAIIAQEDSSAPFSDQQIVNILKKQGYAVARRTIAKYREEEKILSSRQRRI